MANPAKRPAGTEAEAYPNNEARRYRLISWVAEGASIVHVHNEEEIANVVKVANTFCGAPWNCIEGQLMDLFEGG